MSARQIWGFCPPGRSLQGPSLIDYQFKTENYIGLEICILPTHTEVKNCTANASLNPLRLDNVNRVLEI